MRLGDGFLRVLIPLVIVGVAMTIQQRTWVEHPERVAVGAGVALGMAILVGALVEVIGRAQAWADRKSDSYRRLGWRPPGDDGRI